MTARELQSGIWVAEEKTADQRDHHDVKLSVTVLDTVTGRTAVDGRGSTWDWTEGNWSCDCNRDGMFDDLPYEETDHCRGSERFLVVAIEPLLPGYSLADFNDGYPRELVEKFLGTAKNCHPPVA